MNVIKHINKIYKNFMIIAIAIEKAFILEDRTFIYELRN